MLSHNFLQIWIESAVANYILVEFVTIFNFSSPNYFSFVQKMSRRSDPYFLKKKKWIWKKMPIFEWKSRFCTFAREQVGVRVICRPILGGLTARIKPVPWRGCKRKVYAFGFLPRVRTQKTSLHFKHDSWNIKLNHQFSHGGHQNAFCIFIRSRKTHLYLQRPKGCVPAAQSISLS